jgi:8-oxo-dGTP diphosphatase
MPYRVRHGAYGIALKGSEVLIETAKFGLFLPGGGVEAGESHEEALRREFIEETGYELAAHEFIGSSRQFSEVVDRGLFYERVGHFFIVELGAKGEPSYADGHEYPVSWMPIDSVRGALHLPFQEWGLAEALARAGIL